MTMKTFDELLAAHGVSVPDLVAMTGVEVPVLAGPQRQGDVGVFPRPPAGKAERAGMERIPAEGVQVVRGEATGNTHLLHADGSCWWAPASRSGVDLGTLVVDDGAVCYLIHTDEHGANGIAAGTYRIVGKREMADEIRRVAD